MSTILNQGNNQGDQPSWSSYPVKRTIPNHITSKRKPGFQVSSTKKSDKTKESNSETINTFNTISFGSPRKAPLESRTSTSNLYDTTSDITKFDETINKTITDDFSIYDSIDDDVPPARSIYDLNDEILINLDKPSSTVNNDSFINKDPKNYGNVFNRGIVVKTDETKSEKVNPLENGESAILVFGYPEHISNQVIQYFQEFGTILEDFEVNKDHYYKSITNMQRDKIIPCFSGKSWVKITYDNPASAVEALLQNGTVFNGSLLGVIPYTKDSIEKLQNRKLGASEDIGSRIEFKPETLKKEASDTNGDVNTTSNFSKLEMKDGSSLFLSAKNNQSSDAKSNVDTKNNNDNLGVFGNIMKYIFGFNEV